GFATPTWLPLTPFVSPPEPPVPIRLYEPERVPWISLALEPWVLPATIVSVRVVLSRPPLTRPPPPEVAEFPLTVQLVSVTESRAQAYGLLTTNMDRPPPEVAEFPLTVQSMSVTMERTVPNASAASRRYRPPPELAEFPLTVQSVSVSRPTLYRPP